MDTTSDPRSVDEHTALKKPPPQRPHALLTLLCYGLDRTLVSVRVINVRVPVPFLNPSREAVARTLGAVAPNFELITWETYDTYVDAIKEGLWGTVESPLFWSRRARYLKFKETNKLHYANDTFITVDELYVVEDDPTPVDGMPTLFASKQDAEQYAIESFPSLPKSEAINKVKGRKVFAESE